MATTDAVTASFSDVQAAVNNAARNATVLVPGGTVNWGSNQLNITKGIFLKGPGRDNLTITTTQVYPGGGAPLTGAIVISPDSTALANEEIRIEGFTFDGNNVSRNGGTCILAKGGGTSGSPLKKLAICNNRFKNFTGSSTPVYATGQVRGVISGNDFDRCVDIFRCFGSNSVTEWNNGAFPQSYGTSDNLYFETNTIRASTSVNGNGVNWIESGQGSRYVLRYNNYDYANCLELGASTTLDIWDMHGFQNWQAGSPVGENGQTGTMVTEVYGNRILNFPGHRCMALRGGWSLVHNNIITGTAQDSSWCNMEVWDELHSSVSYVDGLNQSIDTRVNNAYIWNNTKGGAANNAFRAVQASGPGIPPTLENAQFWNLNPSFNGSTGIGRGASAPTMSATKGTAYWADATFTPSVDPTVVQAGTLYQRQQVTDPGGGTPTTAWVPYYTPYTYPHPLVGSGGGGPVVTPVTVSPSSVTLSAAQTQQFTSNTSGVTWSRTGAGSINASGLYTAPAAIGSQSSATVTATSGANSGTATVTLAADPLILGLSFNSTQGTLTSPMVANNDNTISQPGTTTDPAAGGRAIYTFKVTTAGTYYIVATANFPNDGANSFFINVDTEPTTANIWSGALTSGIETRNVSWITNNVSTTAVFNLSAGNHTLYVRGREGGAKLKDITFTSVVPANPSTPTTPSPADAATGVAISAALSWAEADSGCTFNVYLGTTSPPTQVSSGLTTTTYNPSAQLLYGQLYYAKVVALKNWSNAGQSGTVMSDPLSWSFTTAAFVPQPPLPLIIGSITATPNNGATPLITNLSATVTGGTAPNIYDWNFADNTTHGTTLSVSHTYTTAGTFPATLTITDAGSQTAHATVNVSTATPSPPLPLTVSITATPTSGRVGTTIAFTSTVTGGISGTKNYLWDFGDSSGSPLSNPSHTFNSIADFTVKLVVTDSGSNTASASRVVSIAAFPPLVAWSTPPDNSTATDPATFNLGAIATGNGGATITGVSFYRAGSTLIGAATLASGVWSRSWTGVTAGDYTLTAKATDSTATVSTSSPITVHVIATGTAVVPKIIFVTP